MSMRIGLVLALLLRVTPLAAQQATLPTWITSETLRIGAVDGADALSRVGYSTVSPDGRMVYVNQRSQNSIRVYDAASGRFIRSIGRAGDGPGEFRNIGMVGWRGDSLYVTDLRHNRVNLFAAGGEFLRSETYSYRPQPGFEHGMNAMGYTADGRLVAWAGAGLRELANGVVTHLPWALIDAHSGVASTILTIDRRGTYAAVPNGGGTSFVAQPMSARTIAALSPDGASFGVVHLARDTDAPGTFRVTRLGLDGRSIFDREYTYEPRRLPKAVADSLREREESRFSGSALSPGRAAALIEQYIRIPEHYPPVSEILVGSDGSFWLRSEEIRQGKATYHVLDSRGTPLARVTAPPEVRLFSASVDVLWGVTHDALDVPYVVRLDLRK